MVSQPHFKTDTFYELNQTGFVKVGTCKEIRSIDKIKK